MEGAVNIGKGYANSESKVQRQTEINSERLKINAKDNTTLKSAVANVNDLTLNTKHLHIESVQDTEKYDSKQTQGGVGVAFAWGSEGSASLQFSQNKAKVDYAQVNQQSGFNIQESSQINVEENTHLKGGIIHAQGDKVNHHMTTGTLTTEEIENRSDIKVSSVSAGLSSDMSKMATSAIGAALSALGNMRESERSQTKAAISHNINLTITDKETQKQQTGKTAEETLASLNRDTQNANQKLEKSDLQAMQEKQEMAQVIGELSASWTNRLVQPHLDEANRKRQEAEKLEKSDPLKSAQLKVEAQAIEAEYGLGSNLQMGIRAATAAIQGLAMGNTNQAVVGLLSPYANKLIKDQTTNADGTVNKEANLMAHAVLGAVEAHITGNSAAAGALGAFTAEAAAPYLMQALYNTDKAENLTDSQKQNIANLSQIAAGLAGGVSGDSTASFISGAEIGKRAVENNLLSKNEDNTLYSLSDRLERKGKLLPIQQEQAIYLLYKDAQIENLLYTYQTTPEKLTEGEKLYLDKELINIASSYNILVERLYNWDFYNTIKPDYSKLKEYLTKTRAINESYDMKQASSLKNGLEWSPVVRSAFHLPSLLNEISLTTKVINSSISSSTKLTLGVGAGGSIGSQLLTDGYVDPKTFAIDVSTAYITKGKGFLPTVSANIVSGGLNAYITDKPIIEGAIIGGVGSSIGYGAGKLIYTPLNNSFNPISNKYITEPLNDRFPYILRYRESNIPNFSSEISGEASNRYFQYESSKEK